MNYNLILKGTDKHTLIIAHIKIENSTEQKNFIDKNHTNLFRGYTTLVGYKKRIKKFHPDVDTLFPYGTGIYGVCLIMHCLNNPELAYMEAELHCRHPQSLLACRAVIKLFQTRDMDIVQKTLEGDEQLLIVCNTPRTTNIEFLPQWVRHYFGACIYAFNKWPKTNFEKSRIHSLIYDLVHTHFYKKN